MWRQISTCLAQLPVKKDDVIHHLLYCMPMWHVVACTCFIRQMLLNTLSCSVSARQLGRSKCRTGCCRLQHSAAYTLLVGLGWTCPSPRKTGRNVDPGLGEDPSYPHQHVGGLGCDAICSSLYFARSFRVASCSPGCIDVDLFTLKGAHTHMRLSVTSAEQ